MAALDVELNGGKQLYELGRKLRESPKKVQSATRRELVKVVRPLQDEIGDEVGPSMPKGYEQVLAKSLQHRISVKTTYWASVSLTTTAKGKKDKRKIGAIDKGILRHPVYGRHRVSHKQRRFIKNPWVDQPVKPGFWTRPVENSAPRIRRELTRVISTELRKATQGVT